MSNRTIPPTSVPQGIIAFPAFLYGLLTFGAGFVIYLLGVMIGFFRIFLDPHGHWIQVVDRIIWYSGMRCCRPYLDPVRLDRAVAKNGAEEQSTGTLPETRISQ
jgi:hypothetical protein